MQRYLFCLLTYVFFTLPTFATSPTPPVKAPLTVTNPRLEYRSNPTGIDVVKPRFSWQLEGEGRDRAQSAYQLIVSDEQRTVWDSGKTSGNATNQLEYAGPPLRSATTYTWKVRSWDEADQPSAWSAAADFTTGLLKFSDWRGSFIGHHVGYDKTDKYGELYLPPARYLRRSFTLNKPVKRATAYATAKGVYELRLNGRKVGNHYLLPGWTDYDERLQYQTFDVTDQVQEGDNAIGAIIADGWYAGYLGYALLTRQDQVREFYGVNPAFLGQLVVEYTDGTTETIATDNSWKVNTGPITEADILMGERYDARLEHPGWDRPGYSDHHWKRPTPYAMTFGKIEAYPGSLLSVRERLPTVEMTEPSPGVYVFNLGKNYAGLAEFKFRAPAGTEIRLRYGEILQKNGNILTANLRRARATDYYVCKGGGEESYTPRFTYHGFQYVEVTGLPERPRPEDVTGLVISSIATDASTFDCANPINNQLFTNIKTTQSANFYEIPTDCPQRDERLGWTGDAQIFARSATFNADVAAFFTKWLIDLDDSQYGYGAYPNFAPVPYSRRHTDSPGWMDAGIIVPWTMYKVYGDKRMLERNYAGMQDFMDFQLNAATDYLRPGSGFNFGDWLNVNQETSDDFIGSTYFGYDAKLMADMAAALGKTEDAAYYRDLFQKIKTAVAAKYIKPDGSTTEGTQTSYALLLQFDLYPEKLASAGAAKLAGMIEQNGDKFTTGFLGTKNLMLTLADYGYHDLAFRLFQQTEYPSWGFSVVNGSTSVWERWNSYTKDSDSNNAINAAMNSFSHYSLGAVAEWMFVHALGLDTDGAGYRKLRVEPTISREMTHMSGSYRSINGTIASAWKVEGKDATFELTVPANVSAEVILPLRDAKQLREGGKRVKGAQARGGKTLVSLGSGRYVFSFPFE